MITSKSNNNIVLLKKLQQNKKYRTAYNMYVIEGVRLLHDAIRYGKDIIDVYVANTRVDSLPDNLPCEYYVVEDSVLDSICDTVHSQGVVARIKMPSTNIDVISGNVLVLDSLQDPGNVGTLMRSAVAFGYNSVVAVGCVDAYSPKVIRSAMSAHFALDIRQVDSIDNATSILSEQQILVADMGGTDVSQSAIVGAIALVLGNEGRGISNSAMNVADSVVSLPMQQGLESLNVAVAGSILMYILQ